MQGTVGESSYLKRWGVMIVKMLDWRLEEEKRKYECVPGPIKYCANGNSRWHVPSKRHISSYGFSREPAQAFPIGQRGYIYLEDLEG